MRGIAVTSGGLDSISMALALRESGYEIRLLHFDYGQKCEVGEATAVRRVGALFGLEWEILDISRAFAFVRSASSLTSGDREILPGLESLVASMEESGRDLWVPGRNLVFLAVAAAHAEHWGAEVISWGANQSETSYPDNTLEFAHRMTMTIEYGCLKSAVVVAPLYDMDKVEILRWGHEHGYGGVYKYTWSCDATPDEQGRPCGVCGCCMNRRMAHRFGGFMDEQEYSNGNYFEETFLPQIGGRPDLWYGRYL